MKTLKLNLQEFKEYISDKQLLCFGAGLRSYALINMLNNWGISENLVACIDNAPEKWGKVHGVDGHLYPVVNVVEAKKYLTDNTILIIACSDVIGIKAQLGAKDEFNDVVYFSLAELASQQLVVSDYKAVIRDSSQPLIPKKIHYAWFGNAMPDSVKQNIDHWHKLCPDYEIIQWNEQNYDIGKNIYMRQAYEMQQWGFVPDYLRLDVIYQHGGIYFDTDIKLLKPPDELLYQRGFMISDCSFFVNLGSGFGAAPKEQLIKEMRDYYDQTPFLYADGTINKLPCINHQYRVVQKYKLQISDSLQTIMGIHVYPMIMSATNYYTLQMRVNDKVFWAHYGNASWLGDDFLENKKTLQKSLKGELFPYSLSE